MRENIGEAEHRRLARIELHRLADPEECARRIQVVDALRTLVPRMDAARRVYAASIERRNAIARKSARSKPRWEVARPPSRRAFAIFIILIWIGRGGFCGRDTNTSPPHPARLARSAVLVQEAACATRRVCSSRFACVRGGSTACLEDIEKTEIEARQIEAEIRS